MKSSDEVDRQRPLAILSAPGSRGDVNPMIAIGEALRQRGLDVVISLAQPYAHLATAAGLRAESLISQQRFDQWLSAPFVWRPLSGVRTILQEAACDFLRPHLQLIMRLKRPGRTVLVSHPLDFASRIHRDLDPTTPLVDVVLAPAMIRSPASPPRLSPWWFEPSGPAWAISAAYWLVDHLLLDRYLGPSINALRREYGLGAQRRILDRWWLSPDLVLGMYPPWFGAAVPPTTGRWQSCGFALTSGERAAASTVQVSGASDASQVAGEGREGIFFTTGTAHRHAARFFADAARACQALQRPGILATTHAAQLPANLPPSIQPAGYVPLDQVLPRCAAIVHHGGIGTTAQAIAAACPQLIVPMAFDQFDNADRVARLGLGARLLRPTARRLECSLAALLDAPGVQRRCDEIAGQLATSDGAQVAAEQITALLPR